ncbi:MAG: hypothetical protein ACJA2D_000334 [Pseudohongiellaceae bacterium]|jgi:hypothetical protein
MGLLEVILRYRSHYHLELSHVQNEIISSLTLVSYRIDQEFSPLNPQPPMLIKKITYISTTMFCATCNLIPIQNPHELLI